MEWGEVKKGIRRINYIVCAIGMAMILPLMLLTFADVMLRGFFNKPIPGSFEISQYILAIFILLGAAYTQQVKGHVGVDFVTSRLSPRLRACCEILTTLLSLFIIAIVVWQGWVEGIGMGGRNCRKGRLRPTENSAVPLPGAGCCRRIPSLARTPH